MSLEIPETRFSRLGSLVFDKLVLIGPEFEKTQNTEVLGKHLPDTFHEER